MRLKVALWPLKKVKHPEETNSSFLTDLDGMMV